MSDEPERRRYLEFRVTLDEPLTLMELHNAVVAGTNVGMVETRPVEASRVDAAPAG